MVLHMAFDQGDMRAPQIPIGFVTVRDGGPGANHYLLLDWRAKWGKAESQQALHV